MTDLTFTYEDGLRLSELYGQLSGLEYSLDHILISSAPIMIIFGLIFGTLWFFGGMCAWNKVYDVLVDRWEAHHSEPKKDHTSESKDARDKYFSQLRKAKARANCIATVIYILGFVAVIVFAIWAGVEVNTYAIDKDMTVIQAQIDAIEMRYGL